MADRSSTQSMVKNMSNNSPFNYMTVFLKKTMLITSLYAFSAFTYADIFSTVDMSSVNQKSRKDQEASYALGVKFHREVGQKFTEIDYDVFLKGIIDSHENKVDVSSSTLNKDVENLILSEQDKSVVFLNEFVSSTNHDVVRLDGVYVVKLNSWPDNLKDTSANCRNNPTDKPGHYAVKFARLKLNSLSIVPWPMPTDQNITVSDNELEEMYVVPSCINDIQEKEMIRGWRTVLNEMNRGDIWAVVIPPALAYGSRGVAGVVDPDVALYFVLELMDKPKDFLKRVISQNNDS